jgi:hypothetical protein
MTVPGIDDVDRIAGLTDPVIRNLQITQCYHELSGAMQPFTGGAANWCTFATWASKQAGQTIREEDLARAVQELAAGSPEISVGLEFLVNSARVSIGWQDLVSPHEARAAFSRAADAVARGNKKVFEEIGREFARFLATFAGDTAFDAGKTARFCAGFRSGEPPDGQRLLGEAFTAYGEARFQGDAKQKAELTYYANLLIGLHEQTRLQPEIAEALDVSTGVVEAFRRRLLGALLPGLWVRLRHVVARLLRRRLPLDDAVDRLAEQVRRLARRVMTSSLMTLHLPRGDVLRLGSDLTGDFPVALQHPTLERLRTVLDRIDATPGGLAGSGASDWSDIHERMDFIANLFRLYHERRSLFDAPFTADQVAALQAGARPEGRL